MADKNYTVDDILNEYLGKVEAAKKPEKDDTVDIDSLLAEVGKTAPQKTEMIEDVLEIGDNSFAFDPGDIVPEGEPAPAEDPIPAVKPRKTKWSDVKLNFGAHNDIPEDAPVAFKEEAPKPEEAVEEIPLPELREGKKTTTGTKALEEVLAKKEPTPEPEKESDNAVPTVKQTKRADDEIRPLREGNSDNEIMEGLMKLKKERGAPKPENKIPPKNRASIEDIDLEIGKKVLPITEVGIDENATESEKLAYLNAKRRERVKEFVVDAEEEISKDDVADFNSFEQASDMAKSIASLKNSLVVRLCILIVCSVVSLYITFANDFGLPMAGIFDRGAGTGTGFLFAHVVLGLIACFVSYTVLIVGFKKLVTLKPDSDSIAAVSTLISLVTGIVMLSDTELIQRARVHIYLPVAILGLLVNTVGKLLIVSRTERNFRYVSGGYSKYAMMHIDDESIAGKFTKGALSDFPSLSTSRKTEFVTDFIKNSYSADLTDSFSKIFVPVATLLAIGIGVLGYFVCPADVFVETQDKLFFALSAGSAAISMMSTVGMMLVTNIPLANGSKEYLRDGGVMLGYSAVDKFCDTNSVLIDATDLFPEGMVDIVNLKPTKKCSIEEGILYAGSLCCQTESILRSAFYKMIKGKTEMLYPVESYIYEDGLGLSGWIQNKRVLFGNRQLMESHSIEGMPAIEKEQQYAKGDNSVLYLSIGGSLAMLFVIQMRASVEVRQALHDLEKNSVTVILRSVDSLLSLSRLTELFGVTPNMFKLLPFRYHSDYDATTGYISKMSSPMIYSGRFASMARLLCGTKRLEKSAVVGVVIQALSAVLGLVLCLVLMLTGSLFGTLTCTVAAVYSIIWAVITAIVQSVQRT